MNKYVIICREGAVKDVGLKSAYGNPCLGFVYAEDEQDAIKKIISYHRHLAASEGVYQSWWCNLAAYKIADDADIDSAEYVIH
jgi:hypothetical protein